MLREKAPAHHPAPLGPQPSLVASSFGFPTLFVGDEGLGFRDLGFKGFFFELLFAPAWV